MKKLLDSDWLRAAQFKCNTGAKSVTPVQITHCRPMISCKAETNVLYGNSENAKKLLQETSSGNFFCANFFMFVLLMIII